MFRSAVYFSLLLVFVACRNGVSSNEENIGNTISDTVNGVDSEMSVELLAQEYLSYLSRLDFLSLEELNNGEHILFSPYLHIDTNTALKFTFLELHNSFKAENKFEWGEYDGTGELISITTEKYFARFVNDVNYLDDAVEMIIGEVKQRGNSISNLTEFFPGATYVEFYRAPVDEELMGMDWRSLILVFEGFGNEIILKAIVHNEWTI